MSTALDKPATKIDKQSDGGRHEDPFGMKCFTEFAMTDFDNAFAKIKTMDSHAKVFDTKLDGAKEMKFAATDATMAAYFKKGEGGEKSAGAEAADAKLKERAKLPWEVDQKQAA